MVQFSVPSVGKARSLLEEQKRQRGQVVTFRGCSGLSGSRFAFASLSTSGDVEPPTYLIDEIAVREWRTVAPCLLKRGLLDETTRPLLAGYCNALARSIRAEQVLAKEGRYYKTVGRCGSTIKRRHPAVQDAEEGWASVRHFAKQLGISISPGKRKNQTIDTSMFK
jgi:P27 family predicted phage terminase small subunit